MATAPRPIPLPNSGGGAARAWDEIRREAAKTQDQALAMEAVKAREGAEVELLAPVAVNVAGAQPPIAQTERDEDRNAFRSDLRRLIAEPTARAGANIVLLCERHGVVIETNPRRLSSESTTDLTAAGRRGRVERLRKMGEIIREFGKESENGKKPSEESSEGGGCPHHGSCR
jgi:hypothetical protein